MGLSPKLEIRQGQQLVMTPQLQQAIRLLQYSNQELAAFVETELERNPLLEQDAGDELAARDTVGAESEAPVVDGMDAIDSETDALYPDATPTEIANGELPAMGQPAGPQSSGWETLIQRNGGHDAEGGGGVEDHAADALSLRDHLLAQAGLSLAEPQDRLVALHLVDLIDEAGYVAGDLASLATRLGTDQAHVERVLATIQTFDPTGVGARSLAECLKLQLIERDRFDPVMARLIDNLPLLGQHNLPALRRAVGVEPDELAEMIQELRALEPKPGLRYSHVAVQAVVPDVIVRPSRDGGWHVELNTDTLPRVLVNRSYFSVVSGRSKSAADKSYLLDCLQSANWLVKSLDQRARTILKVAEEIVRQQDAFLAYGVQHLRPINLKTVAERIKMHESTVSRVTSNKYMATPRGIYELKYFFTSAIQSADGDEAAQFSSEAVRHRIRKMIDAEPVDAILSDDKIVERLKHQGVDIARRTVAKYREAMRISSSVQRRREKAFALGR